MDTQWIIIVVFLIVVVIVVLYLIKRNQKDKDDVMKYLNETEIEDEDKDDI